MKHPLRPLNKFFLQVFLIVFPFYAIQAQEQQSSTPQQQRQSAQTKHAISGVVQEESGAAVPFASVVLYRPQDDTMVTGVTTDDAGRFSLPAAPGNYYLEVSFLSYTPQKIEQVVVKDEDVKLKPINLVADAVELESVEVTGKKDQLQLGLDKKVFNVSESLARAGGSAADILDNIPSVTVDVDGNVSLRGSQNVQVFVDGKPSGLVGVSSTQALRSFPADMIEKVEVITNPSARYQAEGMAGIINIVLKKDKKRGFNGSVDLTTGYPHNHGASVNLNFRRKWYNLFTNYGIRYNSNPGGGNSYQNFSDSVDLKITSDTTDEYFSRNSRREHVRSGLSNTIRTGSDFFLNDRNTITTAFLYRISTDDNEAGLTYDYFGPDGGRLASTFRSDHEKEIDATTELSLNYRRTFEEKDRLLTADIQYRKSGEEEKSDFTERLFSSEVPYLYQRSNNLEEETNLLFQLDYANPFGEEGRWETGLRHSLRTIDNDFMVEEQKDSGWIPLEGFTNHFIYDEQIHAAYGIVGNKLSKFSYQLGLRTEYSMIRTKLIKESEENPRDYLSFFPSAHFTYSIKENSSLEWSYSRRVSRPHFRQLNPFSSYSDNVNIRRGNPDLDPEFTHALEAGYLHHFKKASLTSSIYYRNTSGVIQYLTTTEDGLNVSMPMNFTTRQDLGFEFVSNLDITRWWKANGNLNLFRSLTDAGNVEEGLGSDTYSWSARVNSKMDIAKGFAFQLTGFYRAPQEEPQGRRLAFYMVNTGLSKDIMKEKATLTLNVQDVFNSRKWRSETFGEGFTSVNEFQWRKRQVILNFTWRFNQKKERGGRRPNGQEGGGDDMDF